MSVPTYQAQSRYAPPPRRASDSRPSSQVIGISSGAYGMGAPPVEKWVKRPQRRFHATGVPGVGDGLFVGPDDRTRGAAEARNRWADAPAGAGCGGREDGGARTAAPKRCWQAVLHVVSKTTISEASSDKGCELSYRKWLR